MSHPAPANLPPALLLGGDRNAVSVARSIAESGVRVHAVGAATSDVRHSRFCAEFSDIGANVTVDRYLEWLDSGPRGAVVLPCGDDSLELVARHRDTLVSWGYRPVEANDDALLAMLDKDRTYAIAREAGVPAPWTATVRTPAEAAAAAGQAQYPCALKALYSHVFRRHFGSQTKVLVARDRAALEAHFESTLALGIDVLVTEIVPGADDQFCSYYTYLDERGEPLFHFTKRKLRQWPTRFGLICYQVTNWEPAVVDAGVRFAKAAALRGVVNVEFKRDSRDGVYKLIECNHRFTAANELVRFAGIDIPLLAYNRVAGRPDSPVGSYRRGVRMWDPVEDVRALLEYRRNGELTARTWARSLMHRQHFPLLRWDDPLPTVMSNLRHGRGLARQLTKSRRGRALSAPA